jgi:predicted amidohydrolase YtcJ
MLRRRNGRSCVLPVRVRKIAGIWPISCGPDKPGHGWFPDQKLTAEEAIELYTLGSAYAQFMEDRKGMIKEGYLGDMVIYDRDFMTGLEDEIMRALVDLTIVGGKVVYRR